MTKVKRGRPRKGNAQDSKIAYTKINQILNVIGQVSQLNNMLPKHSSKIRKTISQLSKVFIDENLLWQNQFNDFNYDIYLSFYQIAKEARAHGWNRAKLKSSITQRIGLNFDKVSEDRDFDGTIDLHEALNIIANEVGSSPQDFAEFALETLGIKRNVILKLRKRSSTLDSWNKEEIYGKLLNSAGYSVETVEKVKALLAKDTAR